MHSLELHLPINLKRIRDDGLEADFARFESEVSRISLHIDKKDNRYGQTLHSFKAQCSFSDQFPSGEIDNVFDEKLERYDDAFVYLKVSFYLPLIVDNRQSASLYAFRYDPGYIKIGVACDFAFKELGRLIQSSWIVSPGLIETFDCFVFVDGLFFNHYDWIMLDADIDYDSGLYKAVFSDKLPDSSSVSFLYAYKWLGIRHKKISKRNIGPSEKALSAISFLSSSDVDIFDPAKLFWALSGIESLLADGRSAYVKDMVMRCNVIFGNAELNDYIKENLNNAYKLRNGLIHGSSLYMLRGEGPFDWDYENNVYQSLNFCVLLLLSLIRRLVELKVDSYQFSYALKP